MGTSDLVSLSAKQMAAAVAQKQVSPVELVRAHLRQIERFNPALNSFVQFRADEALAEAHLAEQMVMRGESASMLGVPVTIKSCIDVAGMRVEAGSRLRKGLRAAKDAPLVARLKAAGAVVLGSTNTPEFLMAYETDNLLYGRTNNPWDLSRTAGGSSGGESAAIAACMSACGVGSDGGGSIRVPAHFTGICGLKPTPGRVPGTGHFPVGVGPFAYLGVVGPMARYIEDLQLMLGIMAGEDIGDPMSAPVPLVEVPESELRHLTVGYFEDDGVHSVTEETGASVRAAAEALRAAGFTVEPFRPKLLDRAHELWYVIFCLMGGIAFAPMLEGRDDELSPIMRDLRRLVASEPPLSGERVLNTLFERDIVRHHFLEQMEQYQILVAPVSTAPAFRHGEIGWTKENHAKTFLDTMVYSQWFNLLGNPAAVVPVGKSSEGLPIGVQIIGRPFEDETVLAVAAAVERSFGWQAPPLLRSQSAGDRP